MRYLYAVLPLLIGFLLDCIIGDPYWLPHPVRLIGKLISWLENILRKYSPKNEKSAGSILALCVMGISFSVTFLICFACYKISTVLGIIVEGVLCFYMIAAKSLRFESMKVYKAIEENDVDKARTAVSMIVGRDTDRLDRNGIIKAAVETVAENTSDGVTAPILWMMIGGAPLGILYKSVNTMDSMIGYKNERYIDFGRFAAIADDIFNYLPSRITAFAMILSAYITGNDGMNGLRIWKRDRYNHSSPNSAQTESVCAGALGVQLAGDAYYFGRLCKKKTIGDKNREIENDDIKKANVLMYCTTVIILIAAIFIRAVAFGGFYG